MEVNECFFARTYTDAFICICINAYKNLYKHAEVIDQIYIRYFAKEMLIL